VQFKLEWEQNVPTLNEWGCMHSMKGQSSLPQQHNKRVETRTRGGGVCLEQTGHTLLGAQPSV